MPNSNLRLGNVFNQLTEGNQVEQARNMGYANLASSVADTLSGKDYQPGMSGAEQALIGAARGAAVGFQSKAQMQKAQAQEELNAWAKSLADSEAQSAKALEFAEKEKAAVSRAAIPALSAYQEYKKSGDKAAFEMRLKSIGTAFAANLGTELTNLHLDPNSDQMVVMTLKDIDGDGQQDTRTIDLADLIGPATELNADFAKGVLPVFGVNPPVKESTNELSKLADYRKAMSEAQTPEDRAAVDSIFGIKSPSSKISSNDSIFGKKGTEELQKKRAAIKNGSAERAAARGRIAQVQELLASGTQTGALTELSSQALGVLGTALGVDFSSVSNVSQLNSLLKGQLSGVLSIFGAGTGISNRDVENAQLIIGSVENPADALRKIQAYAAANLRMSDEYASKLSEVDLKVRAGDLDTTEAERQLADIEASQFERIQSMYKEELDKALAMEQNFMRTGSTTGEVSPQEITIDLDGNIVQ